MRIFCGNNEGAGGVPGAKLRRWLRPTPDRLVLAPAGPGGLPAPLRALRVVRVRRGEGPHADDRWRGGCAAMLLMVLWFLSAIVFRWRFQFSIRSLLALALVVAIPCSWFAVERQRAAEQRDAVAAIRALGGHGRYRVRVLYDYEAKALSSRSWRTGGLQPPGPAWARRVLGIDFFADAVEVGYPEPYVYYGTNWHAPGRPIADADMARIGGLARLERLDLADSGVSDAGLNRVRGLAHLTWLSLYDCRVTDAGLDDLKGLTRLRTLVLGETQVTDAGLDRLKGFRQLRDLYLPHDRVTPDGVARLQRALPKCEISFVRPRRLRGPGIPGGDHSSGQKGRQARLFSRHAPGRGGIRPEPILRHDRR